MKTHKIDKFIKQTSGGGIMGLCGTMWVSENCATNNWDKVDCKKCLKLKDREESIYRSRAGELEEIIKIRNEDM